MEETIGAISVSLVILVVLIVLIIVGILGLLLPFFVLRIRNEIIDTNKKLLIINKNLSIAITLLKKLGPYSTTSNIQPHAIKEPGFLKDQKSEAQKTFQKPQKTT